MNRVSSSDGRGSQGGLEIDVDLSPVLALHQRGAIIYNLPGLGDDSATGISIHPRAPDPSLIVMAMLFNERIDSPYIPVFYFGTNIDGLPPSINQYSTVSLYGDINNLAMRQASFAVYENYEKREPGRWAIWYDEDVRPIPSAVREPGLAFSLVVQNAIVTPDRSVSYEEVLIFRHRYNDELQLLRHHILELTNAISINGPESLAGLLEVEKLDLAIAEYTKSVREWNGPKMLQSLGVEMDWAEMVRNALGGVIWGGANGLLTSASNVLSAAGSGLIAGLSVKSAMGFKKAKESPFCYFNKISQKL